MIPDRLMHGFSATAYTGGVTEKGTSLIEGIFRGQQSSPGMNISDVPFSRRVSCPFFASPNNPRPA